MPGGNLEDILNSGRRNRADGLDEVIDLALTDKYRLEEVVGYLGDERPNVATRAAWVLRRGGWAEV